MAPKKPPSLPSPISIGKMKTLISSQRNQLLEVKISNPSFIFLYFSGNCEVIVQAKNFSFESNQNSLQISLSRHAKISVSGISLVLVFRFSPPIFFLIITYTSSLVAVYYRPNLKKLMRIWGCSWNFAVAEDVNKKSYDDIGRSSAEKKGINFSND